VEPSSQRTELRSAFSRHHTPPRDRMHRLYAHSQRFDSRF
jgi:hypothetical protein